MLRQTQGNPFEKHARPSGGGRQPPVWTWFAQGDDGPKRPARNTWLQDGAQATSGNFIERREREQVLHQPRGAPEHSSPTVAVSVETVENLLNTLVADARARFDAFAGEAAAAVSAAGTGSPPRVAPEPRVPEYVAAERAAAEASWGYSAGRAAKSRYGDEYGALYEARAAAEHARDRLHPRWVDEEDYSSTVSTGSSFGSDSGDSPPRRPSRRDEAEAELREAGAKLRETQRAPSAAPAPAPEQKGDDPSQVLPSPLLAPSCEALTQDCVCLRICLSAARPREHSTLRMRSSTLPSVGCFETRRLTTPQIGGIRMERTQHSRPAWCVWHCRLCVALASVWHLLTVAEGFVCRDCADEPAACAWDRRARLGRHGGREGRLRERGRAAQDLRAVRLLPKRDDPASRAERQEHVVGVGDDGGRGGSGAGAGRACEAAGDGGAAGAGADALQQGARGVEHRRDEAAGERRPLPSVLFSATSQHRFSMQMADAERKALALEHVKQKLRSIAYVLKGQSPVELFRSFDVSASTPWQVC